MGFRLQLNFGARRVIGVSMQAALKTSAYEFEKDWFSGNLPQFQHFLAPLKGSACQLLEIGTDEGRAAVWLMDNVAVSPASRLTCIDIQANPNWRRNIDATGAAHRVEFHHGRSGDVLRRLPIGHYDFIYIDGYHGRVEVLEDAVLSFRLAKVGAIIAFDDYLWDDPSGGHDGTPKRSVDAFREAYRDKLDLIHFGYQLWVRKTAD